MRRDSSRTLFEGGHADEVGAVHGRPRCVDGRFVAERRVVGAADEPLVGVDPLVGHGGDLAGVPEQPGDEPLRDLRKVVGVVGVVEGVARPVREGLVGVHSAAVYAVYGLRHESGVAPLAHGDLLDDHTAGHDGVGHGEGVGVPEIDLLLAGCDLVVAEDDGDFEVLQGENGLAAQVRSEVLGVLVEVARLIEVLDAFGVFEVEVLQFRRDVVGVAELGCAFEVAAQDCARVALEGLPGGSDEIAEHSGYGVGLWPPRQEAEGRRIGEGVHVGLAVPSEALDGGAVEVHAPA